MAALAEVPDPEIPSVSIVELGMVGEVEVGEGGIRVELLPTFVGCPALEVIRDAVELRLSALGRPVQVDVSFATPWTSDRISPAGREKLRGSGFAPPPHLREGRALPVLDAPANLCEPIRQGCRSGRGGLPVLRLAADHPREPLRADAVPLHLPLCGLPAAVRGLQADLGGLPRLQYPIPCPS